MSQEYEVRVSTAARKDIRRLGSEVRSRIWSAIWGLRAEPRPPGCKRLEGRDTWRIRVGDYRILYEIADARLVVLIVEVGNRGSVY